MGTQKRPILCSIQSSSTLHIRIMHHPNLRENKTSWYNLYYMLTFGESGQLNNLCINMKLIFQACICSLISSVAKSDLLVFNTFCLDESLRIRCNFVTKFLYLIVLIFKLYGPSFTTYVCNTPRTWLYMLYPWVVKLKHVVYCLETGDVRLHCHTI